MQSFEEVGEHIESTKKLRDKGQANAEWCMKQRHSIGRRPLGRQ